MKKLLILLSILFAFSSCQEEVVLELQTSERIPVIEGVWTDTPNFNQVLVSYSKEYYSDEPDEIVKNATVFVRNVGNGQIDNFRYNDQVKRYVPVQNQIGVIGETYELNVIIEGKAYISTGTLLEPPTLDSLTYKFQEERVFREEGYYLTLYGKIPFEDDNNYRIRIIRNDTLLNRRSDYLLFDDSFGTSILDRGFELGGFSFKERDQVRLELFRLNQDAYDYLSQLVNLLFNDGGLFSPPPQNPVSNIYPFNGEGEVLGYFVVSPYLSAAVSITAQDSD
ncbi:DUF4249 family protein [Belliella aquatica]|uniref:DUF4249 domain-containing protein n=1 Tax=Belliella aquatica TaxID=1323734 RepID=A0ABQ1MYG9_9BACT|nr:DUF4249 family protein [Belliella aquatica]MCH7407351.1 DUF4249 domain-containing protein [Belliella aquatica]GGC49513.1 hypothetical protein GCM10010993_30020 [Belliella aquatica]